MPVWVDLGGIAATSLVVSRFRLDGGSMFGQVPKTLWSRYAKADDQNRIALVVRVLLIRCGERLVLVDAGMGRDYTPPEVAQLEIDLEIGELPEVLRRSGVDPAAVSDVVLTHLHFDHAAGIGMRGSDGELRPALPQARVYLQRGQWERAQDPGPKERRSFRAADLALLRACDLVLLEGQREILPGVLVQPSDGHTRAQQLVLVSGSRQAVYFPADLIPTLAHLRAAYTMGFDLQPELVIAEKAELLRAAAECKAILVFEHDPRTAACRVAAGRDGYVVAGREPDWA